MKRRIGIISVRINPETKEGLQKIADAERRPLSQLIAIILDDYLKATLKEVK